ncbi:hypothetical protein ACELLULO517_21190 [Acidisoma cellulosilytica]|uniref:Alpha/beta hydrolase n=1 Tax=Acidisoma cellulosilyticum TaxID=2802395 RepID=A0A963Z525_9PROT|nr:S9 family peptidase [Acidisoma cellulosilyticum]MCB8882774.1 hypothetical protein [Acidisoma cellulosilyticum]
MEMETTGFRRRDLARAGMGIFGATAMLGAALHSKVAHAKDADAIPVTAGISYSLIGQWNAAKLNQILTRDAPKFFGISGTFTPAQHGVTLYRVRYPSVVPEQGNRTIMASGLVAVPDTAGTAFPMLSYQHGTVYGKEQVPSFPDQSTETALILAQFGGQGYIVIGADYFGMGQSAEPEGYLVKGSHQQATFDMVTAGRAVLAHLNLSATKLFLGGWSQGGFVTMALLEKLEANGIKVDGVATASAPLDGLVAFNGFLDFPRQIDATWVPVLFILTAFSFENYYRIPGLARAVIKDECFEIAQKVYLRQPFDHAQVPTKPAALLRPDYFNPQYFAATEYGRLINTTLRVYNWVIQSPVRNYFGEIDEVITPGLGRLAMTYQRAMGTGNMTVEAISTGRTDHRGTYMTSVPQWKRWFDSAV